MWNGAPALEYFKKPGMDKENETINNFLELTKLKLCRAKKKNVGES